MISKFLLSWLLSTSFHVHCEGRLAYVSLAKSVIVTEKEQRVVGYITQAGEIELFHPESKCSFKRIKIVTLEKK